jgi:glycosyltransferase involved in cell wall biosynthesis
VAERTVSQSPARPKVVVVMPAYNAAKTIKKTYADIPAGTVSQIILVDDVSQDETVEIAQRLGMQVVVHVQNRGYGGNQKTCYLHALAADADIVVMLHPDYQYDSRLIPELIQPIKDERADLVLGSRFLSSGTLAGGMPLYKYISNRFLTISENLVLRQHLSECHTGFRAYSRRLLETIPFVLDSNDFVFDSQVIVQAVAFGFKIAEIAVPTRYFKEASSVNFQRSMVYGLSTLGALLEYSLDRTGLKKSARLRKRLGQVISRYHRQRLLRLEKPTDDETPSPYPISLEL